MVEPRISVIVPHLNQPGALARCLASLAAGTRAPEEVIVVDNGSDAPPHEICARHDARLLHEPTPGPGPARNRGVAASNGAILAFIDADCTADPGWIAAIEAAFADPAAEILGGDVRIAMDDPDRPSLIEAYESVYGYRMERYITQDGFCATLNFAAQREVMDAVGDFGGREMAEDRDWGQRATRAGHDMRYVSGMRVYHPARASFAELARKWDRQIAHDYAAWRARRRGRLRWGLRALAMALSPPAELGRVLASDRVRGARARALAWAGVARVRLYRARVMARLLAGADAEALTGRWNRG